MQIYTTKPALAIVVTVLFSGCAHHQLTHDHVNQAATLTNIHERQVLDNLAMFVGNPDAVPFYAVPGAGSAIVTDDGSISLSSLNGPGRSILGPLGLARNNRLTWASAPITDPARLKRMKCAYRRAIGIGDGSDLCVNCCELERKWVNAKIGDYSTCCDCCSIQPLKMERLEKQLMHKRCDKAGSYCGVNIRVCPESYADFSRLVLRIMDYAVNSPAAGPTMQVQRFVYEDKRLAKIETYTADILTEDQATEKQNAKGIEAAGPLDLEGAPSGPPVQTHSPSAGLKEVQELQILRNTIFPEF